MTIIGLAEPEREAVLRCVAAVLHLGNIQFVQGEVDDAAVPDTEESEAELAVVAELLEVRRGRLCGWLCGICKCPRLGSRHIPRI